MKIWGALVVGFYLYLAFTGFEPFTKEQRGAVPSDVRRGGGILFWHTGFRGGK